MARTAWSPSSLAAFHPVHGKRRGGEKNKQRIRLNVGRRCASWPPTASSLCRALGWQALSAACSAPQGAASSSLPASALRPATSSPACRIYPATGAAPSRTGWGRQQLARLTVPPATNLDAEDAKAAPGRRKQLRVSPPPRLMPGRLLQHFSGFSGTAASPSRSG